MIPMMMPHVSPSPAIWNSHLVPTHRKRRIKRGKPVSVKCNLSLWQTGWFILLVRETPQLNEGLIDRLQSLPSWIRDAIACEAGMGRGVMVRRGHAGHGSRVLVR
mgnify:CR=1 FL=1